MNNLLFKELSILCVEDEIGIREYIVSTLKYYFKDVYEASNSKEAFHIYQLYNPKIIITDIKMEKESGIELIKNIRKIDKNIFVIMLTAYSNEEYLIELINLNINHYILKPLNSKKLFQALDKYNPMDLKKIQLCCDLHFDFIKRELIYKKNHTISLRKREKDFLFLLYKKKGSILKYEEIEFELWNEKEMTLNALKSFIKELRNKIPINIIKNVHQEGYILNNKIIKV